MNTKEAARIWGCSDNTVREYCSNGIIPLAEKVGGKWYVPDEMQELPPVTLKRAVYLLKCLEENVLPNVNRYWSEEKLTDALVYLSDMRFIIGYEGYTSLEEAVAKCRVSKLGKELIASGKDRNEVEAGGGIDLKAGVDRGLPTALAGINGMIKTKHNK